jgi:hypothetical protein
MMQRLAAILLLVAGVVSGQTLQQDMHKISEEFDALPPAREVARHRFKDPPRAELMIDLVRMNTRSAEESEVRARYATGKARRRFRAAQKRAERAERECLRELDRMEHAN